MKPSTAPILDSRNAATVVDELLRRRPAYIPELVPTPGHPAYGLLQIFADYMRVSIDRLNQAPEKNLLAFLDMMGISLIPAEPSRAPVVFQPNAGATDGRLPAGARLGAQLAGAPAPILFETENAIAIAAAKLVEVVSLWPARDEFVDHSSALEGGRAFTLFHQGVPLRHELYLSHPVLLAFAGATTVEVEFELSTSGSVPVSWLWESWDGQAWRPFQPFDPLDSTASQDGTAGLTRSGVVKLRAGCGDFVQTAVSGINAYWVRARLDRPLPPDPSRVFAALDRIRLRTTIERPLQISSGALTGEVKPDQAFENGTSLDLTKTFFPFGKSPDDKSAFYLSSEEAFSKASAVVSLGFTRVITPEQEANDKAKDYEVKVNKVKKLLNDALDKAKKVVDETGKIGPAILQIETPVNDAVIKDFLGLGEQIQGFSGEAGLALADPDPFSGSIKFIVGDLKSRLDSEQPALAILKQSLLDTVHNAVLVAHDGAKNVPDDAQAVVDAINLLDPAQLLDVIKTLKPVVGDDLPPELQPAKLIWEYWDGSDWRTLIALGNDAATNLRASDQLDFGTAQFSFQVPADLEPTEVNGTKARWIRARITEGSYNHLRLVSWVDSVGNINIFPILEPRPPALSSLLIGYTYHSQWQFPEHCLTYNDFQFEVHSADVRTPGAFFAPFRATADVTPAFYLGFDRPLPNDLVSLYFDLPEVEATAPALVWEAWNGAEWQVLSVNDGTNGLVMPGIVSFVPPETPPRPMVRISQGGADTVVTEGVVQAAVFTPGNQVVIQQDQVAELATVHDVQQALVLLETPLTQNYSGGTISLASLPRFGNSRDWARLRLKHDGAPLETTVNHIFVNAVSALQIRTVTAEILGAGTGQPNQAVFFSQAPVLPGEQIEVRELEGGRAHVEFPILRDELLQKQFSEEMIRTVSDPRTGRVTEVWVRWQSRPHLFFSGPADRHYVIERARGRIIFGDGTNGKLPAVGANNIRASFYRSTDGSKGNVPAGKISQLLGGAALVQRITNPVAADGGVDGETIAQVAPRGTQTFRHQGRALAARDYEILAREASPAVAVAKAIPASTPDLRPAPGWVTLVVVPWSADPEPQPSHELRQRVHDFLLERAPATVGCRRLAVIGPRYLPVGVHAVVASRTAGEAGEVKTKVIAALHNFLHPLTGGPDGEGWSFGRNVFLSDVASALEAVDGIDYVQGLELLLDGIPSGEQIAVAPDRMVAAGVLQVEMQSQQGASCPCH